MQKTHILIVEDDADIQQLVSYNLIKVGYHVTCADSGEEAFQSLDNENIDCILLDLMLPGMSGLEICSAIRKKDENKEKKIPIIMLTAKGEEEDIIAGLECGADDYVTKPFSPKILIARLKSVLRRSIEKEKSLETGATNIEIHGLNIDLGRHEVHLEGEELQLTLTEFGILKLLADKPGWVFTRQQIIDSVRGYDFLITPRAVDVQIFGLRKKMGKGGKMIDTVRGIGYRFKADWENEQ
jgi:two-component system, OmpR family, alkaline phosphatase synthesis response regulator PhoP